MPGMPRPQPQPPWAAFQDLKRDFDVREIQPTETRIDPELNALVVVHPKNLPPAMEYAIDQYVLGGGHLLVMVDPLSLAEMSASGQQPFGAPQASSQLEKLFSAWGVGFDPAKVVVDPRARSRIPEIADNPVWLDLKPENISRDETLTAQLDTLLVPMAGRLTDKTGDDVTFTPLLTTSDSAGTTSAMSAQFGPQAMRNDIEKTGTVTLAARLSGKFKTAFPGGPPADEDADADEEDEAEADKADGLKEGESTIIVIADTDLVFDRFCVQMMDFFGRRIPRAFNDNIDLLANAAEQLAGSSDLIAIRSRGKFRRPFDRVDQIEMDAQEQWRDRENELTKSLQDTQRRLNELQAGKKGDSQRFILSEEQREAIKTFREEELKTKQELKEVRKNLRRRVERLGAGVKTINIALMPVLIALLGICFGWYRNRRR
jgi:ABC-type uncharacterized transport system involved in gliding motility auxiliary subunit